MRFEQGKSIGMWASRVWFLTDDKGIKNRAQGLLPMAFGDEFSLPDPIRVLSCDRNVSRDKIPILEPLNTAELALLMCPPTQEHPGYIVNEPVSFGVNGLAANDDRQKVALGKIIDRGTVIDSTLEIPVDDLTGHGLIVGVTRSGKTNTCFALLEHLWSQGIPFLVIESAKSEYRNLLKDEMFKKSFACFLLGTKHSPLFESILSRFRRAS